MMEHKKTILLVALVIGIISMTIAFALLQTNLSISGTATSPPASWDVEIDGWTQSSIVGGPTITAPTISKTSITGLGVNLTKPGQSVTYTFKIVNKGTIDAKLNAAPTGGFTCNSGKDCSDISYNLTCGAAATTANTVLYAQNAGDTDEVSCTLSISRAAGTQAADSTYTSEDGAGTFNMNWTYVQN